MRTTIGKREIKQPTSSPARSKKTELKIINLAIHLEKLTAQLNDGRELSIPLEWFAKWGVKGVNAEKLRKYEIWEGEEIYFSEIDEVLGIEKFTNGFDVPCERSPLTFDKGKERLKKPPQPPAEITAPSAKNLPENLEPDIIRDNLLLTAKQEKNPVIASHKPKIIKQGNSAKLTKEIYQ